MTCQGKPAVSSLVADVGRARNRPALLGVRKRDYSESVEYEVEFNQAEAMLIHIECYQAWVEECHAQLSGPDRDR